ncbi:MAG: glycosyltransferase family 4 protein [Lentisphaerae bacterium]|nr:glycosyltransferase family 4 protein [Lentisphaerota bacterium]
MNVVLVSCVYPPEPVVSAVTSRELAEALVSRGHTVTVLAPFPNRPGGRLYPGFRRRMFARDSSAAPITLCRCFSILSPRARTFSRLAENLSFGLSAALALALQRRPDVIYSNTWPIIATGFLTAMARARRIPVVLNIQDLYPESLVMQGRGAEGSLTVRTLQRWDRAIAHAVRHVCVISPGMAARYAGARGLAADALHVIPNWQPAEPVASDADVLRCRQAWGLPGHDWVALYGGNIGPAAGVETLIRVFTARDPAVPAHLVVAGEGSQLDACRALASHSPRPHAVRFHAPWPATQTAIVLRAADLLLLPTQGRQSHVSTPSKLIHYMLAARPILAAAWPDSDLAHIMHAADCGWVVPPDDEDAWARALHAFNAVPAAERERRGQAGRAYALTHFTRNACLPRLVQLIESAAAEPAS